MLRKKKSAIPAFWLDDEPTPTDLGVEHSAPDALTGGRKVSSVPRARQRPPDGQKPAAGSARARSGYAGTGRVAAPPVVLPGTRSESRPPSAGSADTPTATISINLQLPHVTLPKVRLPRITRRQITYGASALGAFVVLAGSGLLVWNRVNHKAAKTGTLGQATAPDLNFKPLVPEKSAAGTRPVELQYDKNKRIISFADTYAGANVTVSQQELPEKFKSDDKAFKAMAESFGAKQQVDAGIGTLFVAGYESNQFGILKTDKFLLFLRANKVLSPDAWKDYLATMHLADN